MCCPPGDHDWFWNGSINNVKIYDAALDGNVIFLTFALSIAAKRGDPFLQISCAGVDGRELDLPCDKLATLGHLRAQPEDMYEGVADIMLFSTGGVLCEHTSDDTPLELLPHIFAETECSMDSGESDCGMS